MTQTPRNLSDILLEEGVLSPEELEEVLEKSRIRNFSLEETLFKLGYVSRDKLGSLLAKQYECEFVDLYACRVDTDALGMIPPGKALQIRALPYAFEGETLVVALAGPFEDRSPEDIAEELEGASGRKVRVVLCNPGPLKEMLMRFCKPEADGARVGGPAQGELSSVIDSFKSYHGETSLRGPLEELHDVAQTALIGARSHPFIRAVAAAMDEARSKLAESKKYAESGFEEEAIEMAKQAITIIKDATLRADSFEKDWEKLLQRVKELRSKIGTLEKEGAAEYAPPEFSELSEIRESLLECVNERNVDRLRSLLDQGMIVTEKVSLLSPDRNRGREQVIATLAQVRGVIAHAREAGAKDYAPDVMKEAYDSLDRAEAYARHAQWDEVYDCLASAEAKALEAERIAEEAAKEREQLTIKLRGAIRGAVAVLDEAMPHPFAQEVLEDLMHAKDLINEAKACFETDDLERGIELAENVSQRIKEETIPRADEAERAWNELFQRAKEASGQIQSIDIPLALRVNPEKIERLFQSECDMVGSLCERDREKLADAVSVCERLAQEVRQMVASGEQSIRQAESAVTDVTKLLLSAATAGMDEQVASAFDEAGRLIEEAKSFFESGDADNALNRVQEAKDTIEVEVVGRQDSAREKERELTSRSMELYGKINAACSADAMYYCPELVRAINGHASEVFSALAVHDPEKMETCIEPLQKTIESIGQAIEATKAERHRNMSEQLAEIEVAVETAVRQCAGSYAPDMLEGAYLELNRAKELISRGPAALNQESERKLAHDLAVARTRVWQVEFLRDQFERELEENLNQLRLKLDSAREAVDACATLEFVGESSASVQEARELLDQVDNLLIEGDVEESFELIRQCDALADRIRSEAEEKGRQWKGLVESLTAGGAAHRAILADPAAEQVAGEEYRRLSELDAQTQSIIDARKLDTIKAHAERLGQLSADMVERVETSKKESIGRIEQKIRDAEHEMRLAQLLRAKDMCPDVLNAARAYLDIAETYLANDDFTRAHTAAGDALAKARDASTLAQAGSERAGQLARDYMKIAAAHIAQENPEAASDALAQGLTLADLARPKRKD